MFDISIRNNDLADLMEIHNSSPVIRFKSYKVDVPTKGAHKKFSPQVVRDFLLASKFPIKKEIIALLGAQRGAGKTTLAHGLGTRCSAYGHRTLLIDLDPKADLTRSLGIDPWASKTLLDTVQDTSKPIQDSIQQAAELLYVLSAAPILSGFRNNGSDNLNNFLKQSLEPVLDSYDVIIVDCPTLLSTEATLAACFANRIIIPTTIGDSTASDLQASIQYIHGLKDKFGVDPEIQIVLNKYQTDASTRAKTVLEGINKAYPGLLYPIGIDFSKPIGKIDQQGGCLWENIPQSTFALKVMDKIVIDMLQLNRLANN